MQHNNLLYQLAITLAEQGNISADVEWKINRVSNYLSAGGYTAMAQDLLDVKELNRNDNQQTFQRSFFDEEMQNYNRPTTEKNSTFVDYHLTRAREEGLA